MSNIKTIIFALLMTACVADDGTDMADDGTDDGTDDVTDDVTDEIEHVTDDELVCATAFCCQCDESGGNCLDCWGQSPWPAECDGWKIVCTPGHCYTGGSECGPAGARCCE